MSVKLDTTNYHRYLSMELGYNQMLYYYMSVLYRIDDIELSDAGRMINGNLILPSPLNLTMNVLTEEGIYLLDNGINIFIRFSKDAHNALSQILFGCEKVEAEKLIAPEVIMELILVCTEKQS